VKIRTWWVGGVAAAVVMAGLAGCGGEDPDTDRGGDNPTESVDPTDDQGRVWFIDIESDQVVREDFLANYKTPREHPDELGRCTMHNFNFIPLRSGANVLVSAAYTAGLTVVDVDALIGGASEAEAEIGFYRPDNADQWSTYWHNGFMYANDTRRGVDVFLLSDKARAGAVKFGLNNPQTQESLIR
jgi:hypothetical protein